MAAATWASPLCRTEYGTFVLHTYSHHAVLSFFARQPLSSLFPEMGRSFDEDPLTLALAPPPNETPEEREARLKAEAEAQKISERIDEQLKAERAALRRKKPIKVLLLGQGESGE